MAALAVCQTPVKLTSITSRHCSSLISQDHPTLRTPALATTMSTRPSSATPSSKAACSPGHVPDVGPAGHDPAPLLADQFGRLVQVIGGGRPILDRLEPGAEVDGDDVRPLRGQADGV